MLVSMYILCFNHEKMVAEAINGALAQDYSPLEIIISDDCSTDLTWSIINEFTAKYVGPHKVVVRRNQRNLGISEHINEVWKVCSGEWIVASAGDDFSEPCRVSKTMAAVIGYPKIKLFQSFLNEIDEFGSLIELNRLNVPKIIGNGGGLYSR